MSPSFLISESQSLTRTKAWHAFFAAVQFLTRIPVPAIHYTDRTLPASLTYFPLIGLAIGALAAYLNHLLVPHFTRALAALVVVVATVVLTGALHEDGLADCADAFGLRHSRERTLEILRDSRIGTYGAVAVMLALAARILLLAALPMVHAVAYLIAAHVLARWSALPLTLLPPARPQSGQGAKVAQQTSIFSLIVASIITLAIVGYSLGAASVAPLIAACSVTAITAAYYGRRIGGVTGDCFGATNQLVEIVVLACGAWIV